jgi:hypothetical protein
MNARYAIVLMKIKKRNIANIEKKRRITFIITEFYMKLSVYNYVRNFLLIEFPFNLEIVVFVLRIDLNFEFLFFGDVDICIFLHKYVNL